MGTVRMADEPLSKDEELEVVFQMMENDPRGRLCLLKAYGPKVKGLLQKNLGDVLADHDIDVVLHFAVEKAVKAVGSFDDDKGRLGGWFYVIAFHTAVDLIRGDVGKPTVPLYFDLEAPPDDKDSPDDLADDDPVIADLLQCVEELGELQRKLVKAFLLADGNPDVGELSKKLGIPRQHVYSYQNKARASLLKRMAKRGHTANTIRSKR